LAGFWADFALDFYNFGGKVRIFFPTEEYFLLLLVERQRNSRVCLYQMQLLKDGPEEHQ